MKIEKVEKTTFVEMYVAYDGSRFDNKEDCEKYEKSYRATCARGYNNLNHIDFYLEESGLPFEYDDSRESHIFFPQSINDIVAINAYIDEECHYSGSGLDAQYIGKHIAIVWGYDHDWCEWFILEDYAKLVEKKMNKLINEFDNKFNK